MQKGVIHVYTGDGKGKTTASLGVILRSAGHNMKSCIIQFVKGTWRSGEHNSIKNLLKNHAEILLSGKGFVGILDDNSPFELHKEEARKALSIAREKIRDPNLNLLVLDEINVALNLNLISIEDVLNLLKERPSSLNIILTGRDAPKELIEAADLVTEMRHIKHYFDKGEPCRKGIEF